MAADERMTRLEEIFVELHQRNEERHQRQEEHHDQNLVWLSNLAAHTAKMDRRIEESERQTRLLTAMLQEMRAARQNGAGQ